jgi:iron complex transport system substrate-binding protein
VRIVSVLPSATEIVCALGARSELVGRSAECDYPRSVTDLPVVMRPKTPDAEQPSGAIDARVQAARGRGQSLYELDVPALRRLRPDVLLTQDLCGVCSVTEEEVHQACRAAGLDPEIVSLSPRTLERVWESVLAVGRSIGRAADGERLVAALRRRSNPSALPGAPRVAVVEWLDPPILAGLWAPEMIAAAGATGVGPAAGEVGRRTSWSSIGVARPDLLVLSPCSFSVPRTARELRAPALAASVASVRPARGTFLADEAYFSRPGPRLADGIELLRGLLARSGGRFPMPVERYPMGTTEAAA